MRTMVAMFAGVVLEASVMVVCTGCLVLKAESQSPVRPSPTGVQQLECWMKHSKIAFSTMTNDIGRVEFDVSLWDMNDVYPTLTVKLHVEENCIVSRCEFPVFIQNMHCDALVRLFDGRMAQAPAFTYKLDRAKGRAWCEGTTPIGLCGDPLHCEKCLQVFVDLVVLRVAREIGSCSSSVAKIVGVDGSGNPEIERLRRAVSAGDGQACADLGDAYDQGIGVACDRRKAVAFYQLGAARTNAAAMVGLADAYRRGDVVEQNEAEAMKLFRRAARMGNLVARIMVGDQADAPCGESNAYESDATDRR